MVISTPFINMPVFPGNVLIALPFSIFGLIGNCLNNFWDSITSVLCRDNINLWSPTPDPVGRSPNSMYELVPSSKSFAMNEADT